MELKVKILENELWYGGSVADAMETYRKLYFEEN